VFHWQKVGDGFVGAIGIVRCYLEQAANFESSFGGRRQQPARERGAPGIVARYFALDHPLAEICDSFPKDR
jgi:N-glycosylase/DNA lyase